jgi:FKBP-type peptidyl-prolyl cis-trans isomerase (trigger factor)
VIGEGQALPAVEDAIRTLKAGEEAEFDVELPEDAESRRPDEAAPDAHPHVSN